MKRLAILISGRGSNCRAIIEATRCGALDAMVCAVISNRPNAAGLQFARAQNIPTHVVDHTGFTDSASFDQELAAVLEDTAADWILLAGFMRILGAELVNAWAGRMLNIHPSLLPRHPGLNTHAGALAAGDTMHGASVHFVTPALDGGPIIAQVHVPVLADDTADALGKRVLTQEHALYVQAVQLCVSGRASYVDGECYLDGQPMTSPIATPATAIPEHSL